MKGKSLAQLMGMLLFFVAFVFVEDVSAYTFVDKKYEEITVIDINDNGYTRPSAQDVNLEGCADCTVSVTDDINVKVASFYNATYQIKDSYGNLLQTLTRLYYVLNNKPVITLPLCFQTLLLCLVLTEF